MSLWQIVDWSDPDYPETFWSDIWSLNTLYYDMSTSTPDGSTSTPSSGGGTVTPTPTGGTLTTLTGGSVKPESIWQIWTKYWGMQDVEGAGISGWWDKYTATVSGITGISTFKKFLIGAGVIVGVVIALWVIIYLFTVKQQAKAWQGGAGEFARDIAKSTAAAAVS